MPILPELRPFLSDLPDGKLFARGDGKYWQDHDWRKWRRRKFQLAIVAAELGILNKTKTGKKGKKGAWLYSVNYSAPRPYDLRQSFVRRLLMEGMTPLEVAYVAVHSVEVLLMEYAGVIDEMSWSAKAA